jgi:hypothetical protein
MVSARRELDGTLSGLVRLRSRGLRLGGSLGFGGRSGRWSVDSRALGRVFLILDGWRRAVPRGGGRTILARHGRGVAM